MNANLLSFSTSIQKILNEHGGRCFIVNCEYFGYLRLGTGLDSVGDVIATVDENYGRDEAEDDNLYIWKISEAKDGYYFQNERDPGQEFYLFRGADRDGGDYTIYGESEWHDDRRNRTQFYLQHKPVEHGASPSPLSYYITVSDDSYYGSAYYLKAGVAKDNWGCHQVYAVPKQTDDQRDLWFFTPA